MSPVRAGQVIRELINTHGKRLKIRIGVTGTLPKPKTELFDVLLTLGEIRVTVTSKWLIDNGYLSEVEITPVVTQDKPSVPLEDYHKEKQFLSASSKRCESIADLIVQQQLEKGNTLVLVGDIKTGKKLQEMIPNSIFLNGKSKKDLRKEHYDMFEENDDLIVIASVGIASTGISINRIFSLVLVDIGRSFIRSIQCIGRGLRVGHDKNKVYVYDISSCLKSSKKHATERKKFYKEAEYPVTAVVKLKV